MKNFFEKFMMVSLFISLLVNVRQCADSQTFDDELDAINHEVNELQLEIDKSNKKIINKPVVKAPVVEVKEVKKLRPRVKVPEPVDSIDSIPDTQITDSLIIN